VLNREDCVAVTQNYCGADNFDLVWKRTRKEREKVAYLWLRNMRRYCPSLYEKAVAANKRDNFKMRHERGPDDKLSSCSSSSSESSSDSSSDEAVDLDPRGLASLIGDRRMGAEAFKHQGSAKSAPLERAGAGGSRGSEGTRCRSGKRSRRRGEGGNASDGRKRRRSASSQE